VEDAKENIQLLLEEYYAGGELAEACQCIRDLDMPFFHHEIVKKALIMAMEKQNNHILSLLAECAQEGLITTSQMVKGFTRVIDSLDDLSLDIPDASNKMNMYVEEAKAAGWLSPSFSMSAISNNGTQGRKSP
jgi:programmed cell death protein 4